MKRQHPFLSTIGFLVTALLLVVLGMLLWRTGGLAFSPGRLSAKSQPGVLLKGYATHAAFEGDCSLCHQPLKTTLGTLCMNCHSDIADQIREKLGTHDVIDNVNDCFHCHSDHNGEAFDPTQAAFAFFDHSKTSFSLVRHQVNYDTSPMECKACHLDQDRSTVSQASCAKCHATRDLAFVVQHIHIGMVLFTAATIHIVAAIYRATLLR